MGQCLGVVSSPLGGCVSSSGAVPRGNFEVPMRVGSSSSLHGLSSD